MGAIHGKSSGGSGGGASSDHLLFDRDFYLDGQNQLTDKLLVSYRLPTAGYLVGLSVKMADQRTAGTILLKPARDEVAISQTDLDLYVNASYPLDNIISHDTNDSNFLFSANERLGILITTTTFAPLANVISLTVYFKRT